MEHGEKRIKILIDDCNERTGREEKGEYANLSETKVH